PELVVEYGRPRFVTAAELATAAIADQVYAPYRLAGLGDVNGDGRPDLATADGAEGATHLLLGQNRFNLVTVTTGARTLVDGAAAAVEFGSGVLGTFGP